MKLLLALLIISSLMITSTSSASAQQPQLASYRETAHILVDQKVQNQTTAFVTLASTSTVEMRVPADLNEKIRNAVNVTSVVITNADKCVIGVQDLGCVIIVMKNPSLIETYDIKKIQNQSQAVGDTIIGEVNKAFALNAQFNSVYVNPKGDLSTALGTSGAVTGNRTISVIYTMERPDSSYIFDGLSSILIPKQIRDDGGFFSVAQKMAQDRNSTVTFAITSGKEASLYQLQVSKHIPIKGKVSTVKPLELLGVDKLKSGYFSVGFFPLNSILDVTAISNDNIAITDHGGELAPTTLKNNQKFPTDLTKPGWIIDPEYGNTVSAVYLFGTTNSITNDTAFLKLGNSQSQIQPVQTPTVQPNNTVTTNTTKISSDYIYVLIGIIAAGAAAIYLYTRKR